MGILIKTIVTAWFCLAQNPATGPSFWGPMRAKQPEQGVEGVVAKIGQMWQSGDRVGALTWARSARDKAETPDEESRFALMTGQFFAIQKRYVEAATNIRRHLRTGARVDDRSYLWLGAVLLSSDQPRLALPHFRAALDIARSSDMGDAPDRSERIARTALGVALAQDLLGNQNAVAESLATARIFDRRGLSRAACEGQAELPVIEGGHARYLCALMNGDSSKTGPRRWAALSSVELSPLWRKRASKKAAELKAEKDAPPKGGRMRIAAMAAVSSDGPLPTPVVDVVLQNLLRTRGATLSRCLSPLANWLPGQRLGMRAHFDGQGRMARLVAVFPDDNKTRDLARCLFNGLHKGLRVPAGPNGATTVVEIEIVLGRAR